MTHFTGYEFYLNFFKTAFAFFLLLFIAIYIVFVPIYLKKFVLQILSLYERELVNVSLRCDTVGQGCQFLNKAMQKLKPPKYKKYKFVDFYIFFFIFLNFKLDNLN